MVAPADACSNLRKGKFGQVSSEIAGDLAGLTIPCFRLGERMWSAVMVWNAATSATILRTVGGRGRGGGGKGVGAPDVLGRIDLVVGRGTAVMCRDAVYRSRFETREGWGTW